MIRGRTLQNIVLLLLMINWNAIFKYSKNIQDDEIFMEFFLLHFYFGDNEDQNK